jgi:hypothetical protein
MFALVVGALGIWGFVSGTDDTPRRFEAHEFAVFRSEYEALRVQQASRRVEHFRDLLETVESSKVTPGMAESLAEFCHRVAAADEESPTVRAEAKLVLQAIEAKSASRSPASAESPK